MKIWEICKILCFLYLVCAGIYLTQPKFEFFLIYYKKAEHIFHPPSRDSQWQSKPEWLICKMILGMMKTSYLAKEGNLTEALAILESIKDQRIGKTGSLLLRKIYWGLGTLYNQYKEQEKAIDCFQKGIQYSDLDDEFHKAMIKLREEDFFLIYYIYFKYKTSKLLKILKKNERASLILKEAIFNIKEISKQWQTKSKNIFAQDFMNIIAFIKKKIKKLLEEISNKPLKTEQQKSFENLKSSEKKFDNYLITIKQTKIMKTSENTSKLHSKSEKELLLKKLQRNSNEENSGEYQLKDVYKSKPLTQKYDSNFLKNLSLNKSKEIQKTYLMNSFYQKTSRTAANTNRTFSNYLIPQEKTTIIKEYQILQRPGTETLRKSKETTQNKSEFMKKSKNNERKSREFMTLRGNSIEFEIEKNHEKKIKDLLRKIVGSPVAKPQLERGYLKTFSGEKPFKTQRENLNEEINDLSSIEEKKYDKDFFEERKIMKIEEKKFLKNKKNQNKEKIPSRQSIEAKNIDKNINELRKTLINEEIIIPLRNSLEEKNIENNFNEPKKTQIIEEKIPFRNSIKEQIKFGRNAKDRLLTSENNLFLKGSFSAGIRIIEKRPLLKLDSLQETQIHNDKNIRINIIKEKKPCYLSAENRESLKAEAVKEISGLDFVEKKPTKKSENREYFDLNEEFQRLTMSNHIINKSRISLKLNKRESSFKKQTSRDELISGNTSTRKFNQLSLLRKDSSDDERKSLNSAYLGLNFINLFTNKFSEINYSVSEEEKQRQIKAKNCIISRFRKYKNKKSQQNSRKAIDLTDLIEETSQIETPSSNYPLSKYAKSAVLRKSESKKNGVQVLKKTQTQQMVEDNPYNLQRKIPQILISEENTLNLMKSSTNSQSILHDFRPMSMQNSTKLKGNLRVIAQQIKESKAVHKLENIPRPCFFILRFIEGQLMKFKIRIKKFLEKDIVLNLTSQNFSFDLNIPLKDDKKPVNFLEFKTVWPVVFNAIFTYLKEEKLVKEEEFLQEVETLEKPIFSKNMSFLENPIYFNSNKLTLIDLENIGLLKLLLDVIFEKMIYLNRKSTGATLSLYKISVTSSKELLIRRLEKIITKRKFLQKIKKIKESGRISSDLEEKRISEIKEEIYDVERHYKEELKLEKLIELNKNPIIAIFLTKDLFWKKFWLICVSWTWKEDSISFFSPCINIAGLDWRNCKKEIWQKFFSCERFRRKMGEDFLKLEEIDEFKMFYRFSKRKKKRILEKFRKSFHISNANLIVKSDEERKTHKNERDFFKKNEIFGFDLLNIKIPKISVAKNEGLFKKSFDEIFNQFFENKREYLEDEKEKNLNKLVQLEEIDEFFLEKHINNKISIDEEQETEEKLVKKRSLRFFRIEKQNSFYIYLKNFIKEHKFGQMFFKLCKNSGFLHLKLNFLFEDETNFVQTRMRFYEPFRRVNFFCEINDLKDIILLTNILLVQNEKIKKIQLQRIVKNVLQCNGLTFKCRNEVFSMKKIIFNEYSLKAFVLNNFIEKNQYFSQNSLVFLENLENIGKSIIFMNIFENNHPNSENHILFSIKILDFSSKIRRFKLILALEDLLSHFGFSNAFFTERFSLNQIKLIFMKILPKFSLEKLSLYSTLVYSPLNFSNKPESRFQKIRKLKNCFNEKRGIPIFPKRNNGFLEEFLQDSRVILKIIKKFQGNFFFIIVSKNLLINYWIIKVYIPKTSRNFMGYLNNSEIMRFSVEDLTHAFRKNMQDFIEKPTFFQKFLDFHKKINEIKNVDGFIKSLKKKKTQKIKEFEEANQDIKENNQNFNKKNFKTQDFLEEKPKIIEKKKGDFSKKKIEEKLQENENQEKKINKRKIFNKNLKKVYLMSKFASKRMRKMQKIKGIMDLTKKIDNFKGPNLQKSSLSFCETEIWLRLLSKLEISSDKSQKFELKNGEFRIKLKEILFQKYVKIDNYNEAFIEIFFFFLSENPSVFSTLDSIHYAYSTNYNFVIKYLSINRMNIQIDHINLRELINIYISDGFYKHPTNYMHSKLLMSEVKDLCNFLIYKIKSANFCNFLHNANENLLKRRKMHATDNISSMKNIEKEVELEEDKINIITFISRSKPYTLINALVLLNSEKILINLYNNRKSGMFSKEFKFETLKKKEGFFKVLLRAGEWKTVVERLWKMMQKELLIEAEFNLKFSETS